MNAGMIMASVSTATGTNQKQTAVKKADVENSFGSVLGTAMSSSDSKMVEPSDSGKLSEQQLSKLDKLINNLKTKDTNIEAEEDSIEEIIDVTELLPVLTSLANMNEEQWSQLDLDKVGKILTFSKLQEAMISASEMPVSETAISKTLKQQLDTILTKLEKLVETNQPKSSESSAFNKMPSGGVSLDLIKNTYNRNFGGLNQESEKKLGNAASVRVLETPQTGQSFTLQMSKLEQFVLTVEKSGQPVNQEQFVKAFETILNKSSFTSANGTQKLFIQLNPEHLGSMRIELIQKNNVMVARIMATTAQAKEVLESQLQGLKHSFAGQGIQIEKIEINQQINPFSQERFFQKDSESSGQQHQQQERKTDDEAGTEFNHQFEEALLNVEV